jgi:hypothetical protein
MALGRMFASGKDPEAEHSCGRFGLGLCGTCRASHVSMIQHV